MTISSSTDLPSSVQPTPGPLPETPSEMTATKEEITKLLEECKEMLDQNNNKLKQLQGSESAQGQSNRELKEHNQHLLEQLQESENNLKECKESKREVEQKLKKQEASLPRYTRLARQLGISHGIAEAKTILQQNLDIVVAEIDARSIRPFRSLKTGQTIENFPPNVAGIKQLPEAELDRIFCELKIDTTGPYSVDYKRARLQEVVVGPTRLSWMNADTLIPEEKTKDYLDERERRL